MESYEVDEFRQIKRWCDHVSGGWFIDLGSSVGYMSCAALSAYQNLQVVAIGTDRNSLKSIRRLCRYSSLDCLSYVQAMIVVSSRVSLSYAELVHHTEISLNDPSITSDPGTLNM